MLTDCIETLGAGIFFGLIAILAIGTSPLWIPAAVITGFLRGEASPEILRDPLFYKIGSAVSLAILALVLWLGS